MLAGEGWLGLWGGLVEGGCGEREGTVSLSRRQGDCSEKREAGGGSRRDGDGQTRRSTRRDRRSETKMG